MTKKKADVLIVGGGFAGVAAAQKLSKNGVSVTLVDRKDYFEVTFAVLRNVANPYSLGNTPRKRYRDFVDGEFIQAGIESMSDQEARLDNGDVISFDRAVIATGSHYPTLPLAKSDIAFDYAQRNQEVLDNHNKLKMAQSVLVIGGGAVGVEFAGEIASAFPHTKVTLAHSGFSLLGELKPKAQVKALEQLTANGIKVKFNRRFQKDGEVYRCSISNETIQADTVYVCVGMQPNTEFLRKELPDILNCKGLVKVDAFMKVEGYDNLYALGDCSTLDTHKHGYLASVQGGLLANALLKSAKGRKMKPYTTPSFAVITPTGTHSGVAQMPFGVSTLKFLVNLKQKDMGVSNMYKLYGTVPNDSNG